MRRIGKRPIANQSYTRRPGAYGILLHQGQLLLTMQSTPFPEVQLPGGGIDPGETPTRALHREVFEETGWHITAPRRLGAFRRFVFMPEYDIHAEKICHVYLAGPTRAVGAPTEPGHHVLWATPEDAAELLGNPGDRLFLQRLFGLPAHGRHPYRDVHEGA